MCVYIYIYRESSLFIATILPVKCDKMTKNRDLPENRNPIIAFCFPLRKTQRNPISQRAEYIRNKTF